MKILHLFSLILAGVLGIIISSCHKEKEDKVTPAQPVTLPVAPLDTPGVVTRYDTGIYILSIG